MTWTGRADHQACCGASPGPISDGETIARLLHANIRVEENAHLTRSELQPPRKRPLDNRCGQADGCSVDRSSRLTDEELLRRAAAHALTRISTGAIEWKAGDLRQIRADGDERQVVFIYDDPMNDNHEHAVMRVREDLARPDFDQVRDRIVRMPFRRLLP